MPLDRVGVLFSAIKGRIFGSNSLINPIQSGWSVQTGSVGHALGTKNYARKNSLRPSSSLQDLPSYHRIDLEEGETNGAHSDPSNALMMGDFGSSFSKEKALQGQPPFTHRKWIRVVLVLLCLLLFAFLVYTASMYIYTNWSRDTSKYYVVLDCGSTGTRAYVHRATIRHKNDGGLPIVLKSYNDIHKKPLSQTGRAYDRMETEPGLDKLVNNVSGLRAAIEPLIRWAQKQIPKHAHKKTSLYLYATAGVRRLPSDDSKWLLENAWSILKKSRFLCERQWVKIISGVEEAYFGWAALNYQTGMLGAMPKKATFGALDLGGSSLQVTFESMDDLRNESSLKLGIGAVNHYLSAYSLSGYGLNDAFDKSVAYLFKGLEASSSKGNLNIMHPCLNSGYNEQYICSHCAVNDKGMSPITETKKVGGTGKPGIVLRLIGAPDWKKCNALAKVAVNLSEWSNINRGFDCKLQPCALSDNLPRPHGHFYALSGFFVVYRFFNLTSEASLDDVLKKGKGFCEKTWDVAKNSVAPQPFIEQYCFRAPYIVTLLREGLHIMDKRIIIGSGGITWTLGVALLEAGKSYSTWTALRNYEIYQVKINPIVLIIVLTVSLLFLIYALLCVTSRMRRLWRPHLPFFNCSTSASTPLNILSTLQLRRWSPIISGEGKVKTPLSPTIGASRSGPFGFGHGLGGSSIELSNYNLYPSLGGVSHSLSSSSLGQLQFDTNSIGSFWSPRRSQMRLQSRRSQSREDLNSSLADFHGTKV